MKFRITLFAMLALFSAASAQTGPGKPGDQSSNKSLNSKVDQVFAQFDKPDSPGCALAVIKEGQIIYLKDDRLVIRRKKFEDTALTPTFSDAFSNSDLGGLRFIRDSAKRVSGFELNAGRVRHLQFSKESR